MSWTDSAVRRYVRDLATSSTSERTGGCTTTANEKRARAIQRQIDELEERIERLKEQEELAKLRPPIDGRQVMDYLGIEPGPMVGEIMDMLLERRIEDGPYSEDEAFAMVRRFALEKGLPDPGEP